MVYSVHFFNGSLGHQHEGWQQDEADQFLLKELKQKIIQLSQKQSAPTPTAASGQNAHLLHMLPTLTLLW